MSRSRPKRILLICPFYTGVRSYFLGSSDKPEGMPAFYKLVDALLKRGFEVHYIALNEPTFPDQHVEEGYKPETVYRFVHGVHFYRLDLPYSKRICELNVPTRLGLWGLYKNLDVLIRLWPLVSKIRPDLMYASGYIFVASWCARAKGIPIIARFYGTFLYPCLGNWTAMLKDMWGILAFKAPCEYFIMTNDGTQGDKVARFLRVPEEKFRFWLNGVDRYQLPPAFNRDDFLRGKGIDPEQKIILSASRLKDWKRRDRIIKAVPQVIRAFKGVLFLICGSGPERDALEQLAVRLNVEQHVRFTGPIPHDEIPFYIQCADMLISTNDWSNLSNPILEAMVLGKCVVSLNDGSLDGIVRNGYSGVLVDVDDLDVKLASVLIELLENDAKRIEIGNRARLVAMEKFETWDERINKEVKLIIKCIGQSTDPAGI